MEAHHDDSKWLKVPNVEMPRTLALSKETRDAKHSMGAPERVYSVTTKLTPGCYKVSLVYTSPTHGIDVFLTQTSLIFEIPRLDLPPNVRWRLLARHCDYHRFRKEVASRVDDVSIASNALDVILAHSFFYLR